MGAAFIPSTTLRRRWRLQGSVQGLGFRPFVYRLARESGVDGWVCNAPDGVIVEGQAAPATLVRFEERLLSEAPELARILHATSEVIATEPQSGFAIRASAMTGPATAAILPDLATCPACVRELFDPRDHRYHYPFINCTACGPRYSIIHRLPYDRPATTMARFTMCPRCQHEYDDPADRRFHAQPNACPTCGPQVALWDAGGAVRATRGAAVRAAAELLRGGGILALQGLGGFQLVVDAGQPAAVSRLRQRKHRPDKPLAVMVTASQLHAVVHCPAGAEDLLGGVRAPIVLLPRRCSIERIAAEVAPGTSRLGVMLPTTGLHHVLLADLQRPLVVTSGNRSDEPLVTDAVDALERLAGLADAWLVHDRPILHAVDDAVVQWVAGGPVVLRRARGYAPEPIATVAHAPPLLAVGGHLKNTVAVCAPAGIVIGPHGGDLSSAIALRQFEGVAAHLPRLAGVRPGRVVCDLHPDYASTRWAWQQGLPVTAVQHHHAHVVATMMEHGLHGSVLGICWDGTGYGPDGTVWGGEFLRATRAEFERFAHWRHLRLPGGERAVVEPRRVACAVLWTLFGPAAAQAIDLAPVAAWPVAERAVLWQMLERDVHCPRTSSAGRLFDAVAALVGLRQQVTHEGQAAMELEERVEPAAVAEPYPVGVGSDRPVVIDWQPLFRAVIDDVRSGVTVGDIAGRFHATMVAVILGMAQRAELKRIVLCGGCFQNGWLLEHSVQALRHAGFEPWWSQSVPPNDGGLALGQIGVALARGEE